MGPGARGWGVGKATKRGIIGKRCYKRGNGKYREEDLIWERGRKEKHCWTEKEG